MIPKANSFQMSQREANLAHLHSPLARSMWGYGLDIIDRVLETQDYRTPEQRLVLEALRARLNTKYEAAETAIVEATAAYLADEIGITL